MGPSSPASTKAPPPMGWAERLLVPRAQEWGEPRRDIPPKGLQDLAKLYWQKPEKCPEMNSKGVRLRRMEERDSEFMC